MLVAALSDFYLSNVEGLTLKLTASFFFFFNDTATTEIYTLSLHDALPISHLRAPGGDHRHAAEQVQDVLKATRQVVADRKSTRLNSSHSQISYAVFCLKKKKNHHHPVACRTVYHQDGTTSILQRPLDP